MTQAGSVWARRRAAVAAEAEAERALEEQAAIQEAQADRTDAEILEALDLPDPDDLKAGDDFAAFLAKAVPEHIRKKALRRLWRSNPVLACVDGLNDYDEDYLTGSFGNDPIQTTYQVGKGLMAHILELERDKDPAPVAAQPDEPPVVSTVDIADEAGEDAQVDSQPDDTAPAMIRPRRMAFAFAEGST